MNKQESVEFSGTSRIHIGLNVRDVERSKAFYAVLLGTPPIKERPKYAKFEPHDPTVNLSLIEVGDHGGQHSARTAHFGVQVKSPDEVSRAAARLQEAGITIRIEQETACCYAVQDKVWATDPDGNEWEFFVVLDANADTLQSDASTCCASEERCCSTEESKQLAGCCS